MRAELERSGLEYRVKPKDGAFYAPKIDIQITDALGREWQTATIQVDRVMLPERFDLWYIDEAGQQQRPVAIHRAIYGSLERFIGVLTEHFAGAFPLWCAPGPGRGDPDRRPPPRAGPRAGGRPPRAPACGSRSTTPTAGCRTRSASPRSRRCPTCSSSATARWRPGPPPRARGPGSSSRPRAGRRWPSASPPRPRRAARTERAARRAGAAAACGVARHGCAILRRRTAPGSRVRLHAVPGRSEISIARRGRP